MGTLGKISGNILAFIWLVFVGILVQGIREKRKIKIIISSIIVVLPLIGIGIFLYYVWSSGL